VKKTNGMLIEMPIPSYVGESKPIGNAGDMQNKGIELELGYKWSVGDARFAVKGKGRLLAVGNGDIKDTAPYVASERKAWKGRALAVVKGSARLTVSADGLKSASVNF